MNPRIAFAALGLVSALALGLGSSAPAAQAKDAQAQGSGAYEIDGVHSSVTFKIMHMNTSWSFGRFNQISGKFTVDAANPEKSTVTMRIATDSIDTANGKRDGHLKSGDFFDAKQFPEATFTSKSVKKDGEGKYTVEGELDLHGVKKPLKLALEQVGVSEGKIGFLSHFTIKRSDFGMKFMLENLGDEVHMIVSIEGNRPEAKAK